MTEAQLRHELDYQSGQIECLRALVLGLGLALSPADFRRIGTARLGFAREALLATGLTDAAIEAADDFQRWLERAT